MPLFLSVTESAAVEDVISGFDATVAASGPVDILVVDYIQKLSTRRTTSRRSEELSIIANALYFAAKRHDAVVIAVSQVGRPDGRTPNVRPGLMMLKESGDIENAADGVAIVWQNNETQRHELHIEKARDGISGGHADLFVEKDSGFMAEMEGSS